MNEGQRWQQQRSLGERMDMPADNPQAEHEVVPLLDTVEEYRLEQLLNAGYDFLSALALAVCPAVDLHQAARMLANGCDPDLAQDILL